MPAATACTLPIVRHLDFPGFAQEFLRRNPAYRADYRQISGATGWPGSSSDKEIMALRWGLSFPVRSRCHQSDQPRALGCRRVGLYRHRRGGALRAGGPNLPLGRHPAAGRRRP